MRVPSAFPLSRLPGLALVIVSALLACGGKTIGISAADAGPCVGDCTDASTKSCVNIDLSGYDVSCQVDSDCTLITAGQLCSGSCDCGGSPINVSGEAKYQSATSSIALEACPCPDPGPVRCIANTCTLCGFEPDGGCYVDLDGGPIDAPPPEDAQADAVACVDIDLSAYDTSCVQDSDCIDITSGELCTGACSCGGSAINRSGEAAYDEALSTVTLSDCPCPYEGTPRCIQSQCTICGPDGCDGG